MVEHIAHSLRMAGPPDIRSESLTRHIADANSVPKLSRVEEYRLARKWVQTKDQSAADLIIRANLRYVISIAMKYYRYRVPMADLISEGTVGLVYAMSKFEPTRKTRFVTYASHWVRANILHHILRSWSLVAADSRNKLFFRLRREHSLAMTLVGDDYDAMRVVADKLDKPLQTVRLVANGLEYRDVSLDAPMADEATLADTMSVDGPSQEDRMIALQSRATVRASLRTALAELDPRERLIVESRIMADEQMTLAALGRRLGISRERARQIEARAKGKLREKLGHLQNFNQAA